MRGVPQPPRSDQQLLEAFAKRVVYYRLAMVQAMTVLRTRDCPGCRQVEHILLSADIDPD